MKRVLFFFTALCTIGAYAQDYLISFAGEGATTIVNTVEVENLTQGTSLTMNAGNVLHLMGTITGIEPITGGSHSKIIFSPNPMTDFSLLRFTLPESGPVSIFLIDLSGKILFKKEDFMNKGQQIYRIEGLNVGIYFLNITSYRYSITERLICSNSSKNTIRIIQIDNISDQDKNLPSKGSMEETTMQYNTGDRLKFTGLSGIYSTVVVDVPGESKTIKFNFIGCTDGDGNNYPIVQIGTQVWTAVNLKTTKFNDGANIDLANQGSWTGRLTPAYWWYYGGDDTEIKNTYGLLYNWWAVATGKLCPNHWHVMSTSDYGELLFNFHELTSEAEYIGGGKLKESGLTHWTSPNTGATDEFGFTTLPGGRIGYDAPEKINTDGYWWFSDSFGEYFTRCLQMFYNDTQMISGILTPKYYGLSIRCVKD